MNDKYDMTTDEGYSILQASIEDLRRRITGYPPVPTGIQELDALTGGLRRHRFYAVYTHPPFHSSDVALQVACGAALAGKRVLFVSKKRRALLLAQHLLHALSGLRFETLFKNDTAEMMSRLPMVESAAEQVKRMKITFMEAEDVALEFVLDQIAIQCRACPPDLVVVDEFLMLRCMYGGTRVNDFMAEGKRWQNVACLIDAPLFAVDNVSPIFEDMEPHPEPDQMRGFSALEEHADTLMLLYSMAKATQDNGGVACLQVFKNTDGEKHDVIIQCPERYPLFYELRWYENK